MKRPSKVRVVFDHKVLNKYQRSEGLECSWVSLKPNINKISDLQVYVQKSFSLDKKCPNGVVLFIDDFILPPFESTCMLNESDIISVKKKENAKSDSDEVGNKPLFITGAGENSNRKKRNIGSFISMHKENGIDTDTHLNSMKKNKRSDEIPSPKKKDEATVVVEKETAPHAPSDRQWQTQEEQVTNNWTSPANQKTQNYGSANKWNQSNACNNSRYCYRDQKKIEWNDHKNNSTQNHATDTWNKWNNTSDHNGQTLNWNNKNDKEPCDGTTNGWSDHTNNSNQIKDTNKWDNANDKEPCKGTTSGWNDVIKDKKQCGANTSQCGDGCIDNEQSNEKENAPSNEKKESSLIDFESLFPLTRVPRVGDLIAYRLIEMTPQWCPSVTPFRIGEVTSYNYLTLNIVLIPVPEYPIFTDDKDEQKSSQYKEDGTLEIHYASLIDVRLFKPFDLSVTSSDAFGSPEREKNSTKGKTAPVDKWEEALANEDGNADENENENENTDPEDIREQAFTIEHVNAREEKEEEKEKTDSVNTGEQTFTIEHNDAYEEEKEEEKERTDPVNKLEQALASEDNDAKEIAPAFLENKNAME